jgi:glycine cleavage system H protein
MTTKYTKDHEWVRIDGDVATVGISNYAQQQLGDVVFVELPDAGRAATQGGEIAVVESVKAASEVFAPVSGDVTESNAALMENPALVNEDAEGEGWFFKMTLSDAAELGALMDEAAYQAYVEGLH